MPPSRTLSLRAIFARLPSAEVREWLNVLVAVAALLLAVVSFWSTARISGIEDYLHSEIARRNADLSALSRRSDRLERTAEARREAVEKLQIQADQLLATAVGDTRRLSEASAQLGDLQKDVASEKADLASLRKKARELGLIAAARARNVDLVSRQFVVQDLLIGLLVPIYVDNEESTRPYARPVGKAILSQLESLASNNGTGNSENARLVLTRLPKVCPALQSSVVTYAAFPRKEWVSVSDQEQLEAAERAMMDGVFKLTASCLCKAVADRDIPAGEICPDVHQ